MHKPFPFLLLVVLNGLSDIKSIIVGEDIRLLREARRSNRYIMKCMIVDAFHFRYKAS